MAAETGFAERGEQVLQRLESEEIDGFVGDFEAGLRVGLIAADLTAGRFARRRRNLRRLLRNESLFLQSLDQAIDHVAQFLIFREVRILQELLHQLGRNQIAFFESAQDGFAQFVHHALGRHLRIHLVDAVLRFEAALQQEIGELVH